VAVAWLAVAGSVGGACTGPNPAYYPWSRGPADGGPAADAAGGGADAAAGSGGGTAGTGGTGGAGGGAVDVGAGGAGGGPDAAQAADLSINPPLPDRPPDTADMAADGPAVPAGSLIGHWSFDEGSGTRAADSSAYNNPGYLEMLDASAWTMGRLGSALAFSRTRAGCGVRVDPSASVRGVRQFTIAAWTFRAALEGNHTSIVSRQIGDTSNEVYNLSFDGAELVLYVYPERPDDTLEVRTTISNGTGRWVHVAASYDGTALRLYVDGMPRNSLPYTGQLVPSDQPLYIGTNKNGTSIAPQPFEGRIDEVRFYAEALPASAINLLGTL
jgi:hypothetical protein